MAGGKVFIKAKKTDDEKRWQAARADKLEIEVGKLKGKLVQADEIAKEWNSMILAFRSRLLNIPGSLAKILSETEKPQEVQEILKTAIYEALDELSKSSDEIAAEEEQEEVEE